MQDAFYGASTMRVYRTKTISRGKYIGIGILVPLVLIGLSAVWKSTFFSRYFVVSPDGYYHLPQGVGLAIGAALAPLVPVAIAIVFGIVAALRRHSTLETNPMWSAPSLLWPLWISTSLIGAVIFLGLDLSPLKEIGKWMLLEQYRTGLVEVLGLIGLVLWVATSIYLAIHDRDSIG